MTASVDRPPVAQMAFFLAVASSLWLGLHVYVVWRLAEGFGLASSGWLWGLSAVVAMACVGGLVVGRLHQTAWAERLTRAVYLYFGAFSVALAATLVAHGLLALAALAGGPPAWLAPALAGGALAATAYVTVAGARQARRAVPLVEVEVPLEGLSPDLDGYRIVQLSDVHLGAPATAADLEAVVETALGAGGDLIAFVGDLVDGSVARLGDQAAAMARLKARDGAYFVTGNHEYYSGAREWERYLDELGLIVLGNEHRRVKVGGATLVVAGVTDTSAGQFSPADRSDPARALAGAGEADCVVLLAHNPRSIHAAAAAGVDLQLSGHTHGGQFPPWTWLVGLFTPYVRGLHRHGRTWIYVSCGSGLWGPPMRLGAPAEVTVVTLRRV